VENMAKEQQRQQSRKNIEKNRRPTYSNFVKGLKAIWSGDHFNAKEVPWKNAVV